MSKKRKAEIEMEKNNKKASLDISNNKNIETTKNLLSSTLINPNISPPKFNPNVTVISTTSNWIKSNKSMKNDNTTNMIKIKEEPIDEEKLLWMESMKDKIILLFDDLEIQSFKTNKNTSVSKSVNTLNSTDKNNNFKKFKKVSYTSY